MLDNTVGDVRAESSDLVAELGGLCVPPLITGRFSTDHVLLCSRIAVNRINIAIAGMSSYIFAAALDHAPHPPLQY